MHVGAVLDQQPHDVGMPLGRRPHQRSLPPRRLPRVDVVGTGVEQGAHRVRVPGARAGHEDGLAHRGRSVGVGAGRQQPLDDRRAAVDAGERQRRDAVGVGRAGPRARVEQYVHDGDVIPPDRPVQHRRAVALGGVHVGAQLDEGAHRGVVAASHRLLELGVGRLGRHAGAPHRHDQPCDDPSRGASAHALPSLSRHSCARGDFERFYRLELRFDLTRRNDRHRRRNSSMTTCAGRTRPRFADALETASCSARRSVASRSHPRRRAPAPAPSPRRGNSARPDAAARLGPWPSWRILVGSSSSERRQVGATAHHSTPRWRVSARRTSGCSRCGRSSSCTCRPPAPTP